MKQFTNISMEKVRKHIDRIVNSKRETKTALHLLCDEVERLDAEIKKLKKKPAPKKVTQKTDE